MSWYKQDEFSVTKILNYELLFFFASSLCFLLFSFTYSYLTQFLTFSLPGIIV